MKTMLKRGAGVLMPIFSLPSPYGIGTFGRAAYEFIDQLKRGRQTYWQVLPMGPTCYGDSPYQSYSAFAGNPYFIDLDTLKDEKLLTQDEIDACWWCDKQDQVKYDALYYYRFPLLRKAYERSSHKESVEYQAFLEENEEWLDDYALYMAVKGKYEGKGWMDWDEDIRFRRPEALSACREELAEEINYWKFLQFKFFEQWKKLKQYAKEKKLQIVGDIPIYVALDSADVWSHPELFQLDEENLTPLKVSGVPPDAFSEDGQLWGNPLYDWEKMEQTDFAWWRSRMKASAKLYDAVRIDHFIGVVQYYAIPYGAVTAKDDRSHMPLKLTEAGKIYMRYLESVGVLTGQFEEQLGELKTGRSRTLNVGMTLWRGSVLLPDILPSYSESHPDVRITLREHHTAQLSKLLQEDQIDFALMNMPLNLDDFVYDTVFNERLLLVASKDHPAIRGLEAGTPDHPLPIDMKKLRRERFILLQEDQVMGHAMKNLFAKMNMEPKDALYTTSSTTSVNLAARGFGITFLPEGGIRHTAHVEQLAFFTVDNPPFSVPLLLLYKKNSIISPHAKDFIDMVKEYYRNLEANKIKE